MAIGFNGSSDKLLDASNAAVSGRPATICAFVKRGATGSERALIGCSSSSSSTPLFRIGVRSGGEAFCQYRNDASNSATAISATVISSTAFDHVCGILEEGTDGIRIYFNGILEVDLTVSETTAISLTQTDIGVLQRTSPAQFFNGEMCEGGIWNVALTDGEIEALAARISPILVRPNSIATYVPMVRQIRDVTGQVSLTVTGTSVVSHASILKPSAQILQFPPVVVGGVTIPVFERMYRSMRA